jgi:hypothetical protein
MDWRHSTMTEATPRRAQSNPIGARCQRRPRGCGGGGRSRGPAPTFPVQRTLHQEDEGSVRVAAVGYVSAWYNVLLSCAQSRVRSPVLLSMFFCRCMVQRSGKNLVSFNCL